MPNPTKAEDLGIPSNPLSQGVPIAQTYIEDGSVPIFWGDNQTRDEDTYEYARPSKMVKHATMAIPKVVRFIYTYDEDDDIEDKWGGAKSDECDGGGGGGGSGCEPGSHSDTYIIGRCYGGLGGEGFFIGWQPRYQSFGWCPGPIYYYDDSPGGDPCSWTVSIIGADITQTNPSLVRQQYYYGPVSGYKPSQADMDRYRLPTIFGAACCDPTPPPPPPPISDGCGDGEPG